MEYCCVSGWFKCVELAKFRLNLQFDKDFAESKKHVLTLWNLSIEWRVESVLPPAIGFSLQNSSNM